ncbi:hypothetical protein D3C85_1333290 [compost metagenome]
MVLPGHGAEAAHLPEQPLQALLAATRVLRDETAGLLGEIEQDGAGLEQRQRRAAICRLVVDNGGDAIVRRDLQEVRLELFVLADIDRVDAIGQSGLLEEQADLVAVGRGPVVQVDHREGSSGSFARS